MGEGHSQEDGPPIRKIILREIAFYMSLENASQAMRYFVPALLKWPLAARHSLMGRLTESTVCSSLRVGGERSDLGAHRCHVGLLLNNI